MRSSTRSRSSWRVNRRAFQRGEGRLSEDQVLEKEPDMRPARTLIVPVVALALLAVSCDPSNGSTATRASSVSSIVEDRGAYRVTIDPADFVDVIDNPYF